MIALTRNEAAALAGEESSHPDEMSAVKAKKTAMANERGQGDAKQDVKSAPALLPATQVALLQDSFALVKPKASIAALAFYRNLFTLDPSLRAMFHTNIELQGRKLMEALEFTVASIESPQMLGPVLEALGRRHVAYGVRDEHYDTVAKALLQTLEEALGPAYTLEVARAWGAALTHVAGIMKKAAASVAALKGNSLSNSTEEARISHLQKNG